MRIKLVIFVDVVNKLMNVNDLLLNDRLDAFTDVVNEIIVSNLQSGKVHPQLEPYQQFEIEDFSYSDH